LTDGLNPRGEPVDTRIMTGRLFRPTMVACAVVAALSLAFLAFNAQRGSAHASSCGRLRTDLQAALTSPHSTAQVRNLSGSLAADLYDTRTGTQTRIAQAAGDTARQTLVIQEWDRWETGYTAQVLAAKGCS
jgi:hypothetical protein